MSASGKQVWTTQCSPGLDGCRLKQLGVSEECQSGVETEAAVGVHAWLRKCHTPNHLAPYCACAWSLRDNAWRVVQYKVNWSGSDSVHTNEIRDCEPWVFGKIFLAYPVLLLKQYRVELFHMVSFFWIAMLLWTYCCWGRCFQSTN